MYDKIWCPLNGLSKFEICPQDTKLCTHYKKLFSQYLDEDICDIVYYCELVTVSMLLNRGNGFVSKQSWIPNFPEYKKMKEYLYKKYFSHLMNSS